MYTLSCEDIFYGLAVTDIDYAITVQGKINLSIFDSQKSEDDRAGLQVDLSGKKYIKITVLPDENGEYQVTLRKETCDGISAVPFFEQATNELVKRYGADNNTKQRDC